MKKNEAKDTVKSLFRSGKTWVLIAAILGIALGLFMIISPDVFLAAIFFIIGGLLVLFGAGSLVQVFRSEAGSLRFGGMVPGVISLTMGLAFIFRQEDVQRIIWYFVGIIILVDAVYKLEHAFTMRAAAVSFWWILLLAALLTMILAVVVMITDLGGHAMVILGGAMLLVNGLFDLSDFILLTVAGKQLKNVAVVTIEDAPGTEITDVQP